MGKIYTFNNKIVTLNNKWCEEYVEPTPPGPSFDEVTIGTQTWMSKNLAIDDGGTGIAHFDNVTANGINFGTQYFYTLDAATRIANSTPGWHLPTQAEFQTLVNYVGRNNSGTKLKSTSGWNDAGVPGYGNGTDDYGFTVLPIGVYYNGNNSNKGRYSRLLSNTIYASDSNYLNALELSYDSLTAEIGLESVTGYYSVRLIKDT